MATSPTSLLTMTVDEVLRRFPAAPETFRRIGLADCLGCSMAAFDTLAEALRTYRVDPDRALPELSKLLRGTPCPPAKS